MAASLQVFRMQFFKNTFRPGTIKLRYKSTFKQTLRNVLDKFTLPQSDVKFVPYSVSSDLFGSSCSSAKDTRGFDIAAILVNEGGQQSKNMFGHSSEPLFTYQIGLNSLFQEGVKNLYRYVDGDVDHVEVEELLPAIAALFRFITDKDFHQTSLQSMIINKDLQDETDISTILAVHLFSQLTFYDEPSYMISDQYNFKHKFCPCENFCRKTVIYGNTSIGTHALCHGRPDIVLLPNRAGSSSIVVPSRMRMQTNLKQFKDDDVHSADLKCDSSSLRDQNNVKHASLIALTFSLYQRVIQHRLKLQRMQNSSTNRNVVSLIPTVAVSSEGFDIYMYDTENDIFLRNVENPVPLWDFDQEKNPTLNLSSVLSLWMLINHIYFKPVLTNDVIRALKGKYGLGENFSEQRIKEIENIMNMSMFRSYKIQEGVVEKARKIELGQVQNQHDPESF